MPEDHADPNADPWALPEPPAARPAWTPPGHRPGDPYGSEGGPYGAQGGSPLGPPGPRRPGMPRWGKVVIVVWAVLSLAAFAVRILLTLP